MKQIKLTVVALGVLAMLAGCTGDQSTVSSSSNGYEVSSGLAQKGPLLRGSSVTVNELNTSTLQPSGKSYTFEVLDDLGTFKPSNITFTSAYLENTALGYYFNELTGQPSSDMVYLRGLSYLGTDKAVNLNVLSTFVKNRIKRLVTTAPVKTFVVARPQAERELLGAFYIYNAVDLMSGTTVGSVIQPKTFMELDLSKKRAGDQILAAISGMVAQIGQTGSGVNYFLNQVETDLADDGLINNSPNFPVSVQQQLSDAAKSTDFGAVAANLNAFYKTNYSATDLSQWVDTSGGVDKVIDKYKFSASNVPVGTESKSPEYVAGSEDAVQCFSVSAGKLYRNGVAVATGTVKAVKGDKFVIGLTGNAGGTTYSGFVQRSAPDAKGVCPQVVPNSGLTRVEKYQINLVTLQDVIVGVGRYQTYAIVGDGTFWGWGRDAGTSVNGVSVSGSVPRYLGSGFISVSAGGDHTLGLKADGTLWAWGSNGHGQLGDGTTIFASSPKKIGDGYKFIAAASERSYAIKNDGSLWGWGNNINGECCEQSYPSYLEPVWIGDGYESVSPSQDSPVNVLAIKSDKTLWGWGWNLGCEVSAVGGTQIYYPVKVGDDFVAASSGHEHGVGIKSDGSLWSWGAYFGGTPGIAGDQGTPYYQCGAKKIGEGYKSVVAGAYVTAAVKNDGTLMYWGVNSNNQPAMFDVGYNKIFGTFESHFFAQKIDGSVWGWGDNISGWLGDGTSNAAVFPVRVNFNQ